MSVNEVSYCIPNTCNGYRDRRSHIVDRRRVRTGFTDNLQLPIVGLWRRTTIVDEGREDALPRGGCLVSYLRYLGSVKDRYFKEGERRLYGPSSGKS